MDFYLVKTGAGMFDALHAYGLGTLLAHVSGLPVDLRDGATVSALPCSMTSIPRASYSLLDDLLALPTAEELLALPTTRRQQASLEIGNLDGLLATLFTSPGARSPSVGEVLWKSRLNHSAAELAIKKVRTARERWKKRISRHSGGTNRWLEQLLRDYDPDKPAIPVPRNVDRGNELSLLMTIDPSFGYSTRRSSSDGFVTQRTNVTIRGASFAVLLAYIGAARFLRAIPVKGDLVVFFVPVAAAIRLLPQMGLPLLAPAEYTTEQALVLQWLEYVLQPCEDTRWSGLVYLVVQKQGAQQSIPRERGYLDLSWCESLQPSTRAWLFSTWRRFLSREQERHPCDLDHLLDSLRTRSARAWAEHLYDVAECIHYKRSTELLPYPLEAVKEVTTLMNSSTPSKLAEILDRRSGTLRFGHALRLLGQVNAAALRDLVEDLQTVQTLDQLLLVLAQAAQDCQVAAAKSPFTLVPSDEDLKYLLEDVEQAGAQTIARFLITLSALRYPRLEVSGSDAQHLARINLLLLAVLGSALGEAMQDDESLANSHLGAEEEVSEQEKAIEVQVGGQP